ncbi:MAG TPA: zinc-ribbon domain-containing protein [Chloroflexia bacterium]|nr:zinc-ribbon domain-containing protein [Chloroflexia bacterium]
MSMEPVTCPSCGNQVPSTSRFCPECGYNLTSYAQATGQLPGLSAGTPTLDLGSLTEEQRSQLAAASQPSSTQQPTPPDQSVQGGAGTPVPGQSTSQGQSHGGSLVPVTHDELALPPPPLYRDSQMLQPSEFQPAGPVQSYPTFSQPSTTYGSYQVQLDDDAPAKNPIMGFLLELLGLVGFLGVGHMYSGHVPRGISLMLLWFVYGLVVLFVVIPANLVVTFCTLGTVQCFMYPFIAIFIIVPLLSGFWAHNELEADMRRRTRRY